MGNPAHLAGLNLVGLKRRGASRADIHELRAMLDSLGAGSFRDTARHLAEGEAGPTDPHGLRCAAGRFPSAPTLSPALFPALPGREIAGTSPPIRQQSGRRQ